MGASPLALAKSIYYFFSLLFHNVFVLFQDSVISSPINNNYSLKWRWLVVSIPSREEAKLISTTSHRHWGELLFWYILKQ